MSDSNYQRQVNGVTGQPIINELLNEIEALKFTLDFERKNILNNFIIISDYDGGYCLTVWVNGKNEEECVFARNINKMYRPYDDESIKAIMNKYNKDVLLCEDGTIEYFEYKGEKLCS